MPRSSSTAGGLICNCSTCRRRSPALAAGLRNSDGNAVEDADRDILVDRLLMEQHGAATLGDEGDAGPPRRGGAAEGLPVAADRQRPRSGLSLPNSIRANSGCPHPMKP